MSSTHAVVGAVALLVLVAAADAMRNRGAESRSARAPQAREGFRIDLESSRRSAPQPVRRLREAFPGRAPASLAVSKVAMAPDEVFAVALSYVPGDRASRAAIELWDGDRLVRAFRVPVGSFSLGLWFADGGNAIATIGWDERAHVYDRRGRRLGDDAYFAYETG